MIFQTNTCPRTVNLIKIATQIGFWSGRKISYKVKNKAEFKIFADIFKKILFSVIRAICYQQRAYDSLTTSSLDSQVDL